MRTLREVLGEKELTEIRDSILEGTKKYQEKLGQVIIEQNLPRKNQAARIYDFLAILTEGLNAKTNFAYNIEQLQIIIKEFYFKDQNSIGRLKASDLNH
jgi:DNA polymerase III alpha subunit (gram-positive type)